MKSGIELIAEERQRQIDVEEWNPSHDDEHADESLALAACCYAKPLHLQSMVSKTAMVDESTRGECAVWRPKKFKVPHGWPTSWHPVWWKRRGRVRMLVIAGALIAAEIDRLNRASSRKGPNASSGV